MDIAVIAYHSGDEYENNYSSARIGYYGITGFPTVKFDGVLTQVGGGSGLYQSYLAKYNTRIAIPSSYSIDIEGAGSGLIDYQLTITVEKTATGVDNPVLHVAIVESHIPENWGGLSEVNYVERIMLPSQSGTTLDFTTGNSEELIFSFSCDPTWDTENCEVVVFLQNNNDKEILQGAKGELSAYGGIMDIDASIKKIYVPQTVCNESFVPKIELGNNGSTDLTSIELFASVNGEVVSSLTWTGNLAYGETELVTLPEATFTLEADNVVTLEALNPNGQADQVPFNNINGQVLEDAPNVTAVVNLALKLDDNPEETSWELTDSQGNVVYSGGPYTQAGQFVIEQFTLSEIDCYTFMIFDEGGDGLTGQGLYKLATDDNTIFGEGKDFGYEDQVQFGFGLTGNEEIISITGFEIYPNPVHDKATIQFDMEKSGEIAYKIYNYMGAMVQESNKMHFSEGNHMIPLSTEKLKQGVYIIEFRTTDQIYSEQIIISK